MSLALCRITTCIIKLKQEFSYLFFITFINSLSSMNIKKLRLVVTLTALLMKDLTDEEV